MGTQLDATNFGTEFYEGLLDELHPYSRALSATEVLSIFEAADPGTCGDADDDGVPDERDICPGGDDKVDLDGDGVPDFCDPCPNDAETTPTAMVCAATSTFARDDTQNADGDALPDFCDVCPLDPENDADGDGVCESGDNCPIVANENQPDLDGTSWGMPVIPTSTRTA